MPRQGPRSVLDDLGEEITGIIAPVSICMALVVVLVKALNPEGAADTTTVAIATIAYQEQVGSVVCTAVRIACRWLHIACLRSMIAARFAANNPHSKGNNQGPLHAAVMHANSKGQTVQQRNVCWQAHNRAACCRSQLYKVNHTSSELWSDT